MSGSAYQRGLYDGSLEMLRQLAGCASDVQAGAERALDAGNRDLAQQLFGASRAMREFVTAHLAALEGAKP